MPKTFTDGERAAIIPVVLKGLSAGTPLTVICAGEGMPCDDTVRRWADDDAELARDIARAREAGWDAIALEAKQIIDAEPERVITTSGEDRTESRIDSAAVQWAKNRVELRLKLLAKWDPKRYGDRQLIGSDPENPLPKGFTINLVKRDQAG
ncbi:hypothetical protein FPZ24_08215 [Sphingomonas panacisoli]|uniref:Terminase small subunit protein n=1 Tax=Sphingomonas panacisoli TaxID=1813879 RepID=A0A5B8LGV5_9SPHN|nr:hypothetical protein [Sphingomonas panacisoli]QDZ07467.1 hypothetical protein FPZ24_08215 [Sphingomonas panacisoli]